MQRSLLAKWTLILLIIVLSFTILITAKTALIPLTLAGLLTMLFIPFTEWLEKKRFGRALASLVAVLVFLIVMAVIIGLFSWQLSNMVNEFSSIQENITKKLQQLQSYLYRHFGITPDAQKELVQNEEGGKAGTVITTIMGSLLNVSFNLLLILVYMFLLLYMRSHIKTFILKLVAEENREKTGRIIRQSSEVAQKYLLGTFIMIAMLWVMYGIGFTLVGVKNALFFAVVCGTLEIIPFVGNLTGNILAILMVLSQGGGIGMVLSVLITYSVVQFGQSYIIQPYIVGGEVNINPLATIFVLIIGELVWGIAGMILAIPVTAIIKIIFDNIPALKPYGYLIGGNTKQKNQSIVLKLKKWFGKK